MCALCGKDWIMWLVCFKLLSNHQPPKQERMRGVCCCQGAKKYCTIRHISRSRWAVAEGWRWRSWGEGWPRKGWHACLCCHETPRKRHHVYDAPQKPTFHANGSRVSPLAVQRSSDRPMIWLQRLHIFAPARAPTRNYDAFCCGCMFTEALAFVTPVGPPIAARMAQSVIFGQTSTNRSFGWDGYSGELLRHKVGRLASTALMPR